VFGRFFRAKGGRGPPPNYTRCSIFSGLSQGGSGTPEKVVVVEH
jgi:hypothetical protein